MSETKTRYQGLDILRLLSVVMVIGIHTAGGYFMGEALLSERCQAAPWYALSVGAVPLFVMMSGAFMLSPSRRVESLTKFYKRGIGRKILLPLIFWSVVYYVWFYVKEQSWQPFRWHHLWYLVMLASLYAITPMIRRLCEWIETSSKPLCRGNLGLLILTLGSYLLSLSVDLYCQSVGVKPSFLLWWVQYLPFYLAGYLLHRSADQFPSRGVLFTLLFGSMVLYGLTLILEPRGVFWQIGVNFSPLVVIKVVSLFALCYGWRPHARFAVMASRLYPFVMGIYLVHFAVLHVVFKLLVLFSPELVDCVGVSVPLRILLIALISFGLTAVIRKVPILRQVV